MGGSGRERVTVRCKGFGWVGECAMKSEEGKGMLDSLHLQ